MSRKKRRKNYRGHYCWCCESILPNEKFSGKGHARHLCKQCRRLGGEELAFRQAVVNMERCLDRYYGTIRRKCRAQFNRFLDHKNARVRKAAEEILAEDARVRAEFAEMRRQEEDELASGLWMEYEDPEFGWLMVEQHERDPASEDGIPF